GAGELLPLPEDRAREPRAVPQPPPRAREPVRLHRGLLQPPAHPLDTRLLVTRGLRARPYKRRLTATDCSRAGAPPPTAALRARPVGRSLRAAPQHSCTDASSVPLRRSLGPASLVTC